MSRSRLGNEGFRLHWRVQIALESLLRTVEEARLLRRVQALVWRSQGESVSEIAARLQVSRQTVHNWIARFQTRAGWPLRERLRDEERPGRPPTAKGIIDAVIEPLLECDPRAFGYAATVWTAPLLRRHLERVQQIPVSERSVRRAIHRLGYGWKRPRYRLALRPATWRQAKGGSKAAWGSVSARSF
jgi:transposase